MDGVLWQFGFLALAFISLVGLFSLKYSEIPPINPDEKYPNRSGPDIDSMRRVYAAWQDYKNVKNAEIRKRR